MTIAALKPVKLQAPESLLCGQGCDMWQLLNLRLRKPTLGYSPEAESDEPITEPLALAVGRKGRLVQLYPSFSPMGIVLVEQDDKAISIDSVLADGLAHVQSNTPANPSASSPVLY